MKAAPWCFFLNLISTFSSKCDKLTMPEPSWLQNLFFKALKPSIGIFKTIHAILCLDGCYFSLVEMHHFRLLRVKMQSEFCCPNFPLLLTTPLMAQPWHAFQKKKILVSSQLVRSLGTRTSTLSLRKQTSFLVCLNVNGVVPCLLASLLGAHFICLWSSHSCVTPPKSGRLLTLLWMLRWDRCRDVQAGGFYARAETRRRTKSGWLCYSYFHFL